MVLTLAEKRKKVADEVRRSIKRMNRTGKAASRDVLKSLQKARKEIGGVLMSAQRFEMGQASAILADINEKIADYQRRFTDTLGTNEDAVWQDGSTISVNAFKKVGIDPGVPHLSDELLQASKLASAELVAGLTNEMSRDIARTLRRGILTGKNTFDTARDIDKILGITKERGYANRSDVITRTEIGRVYSVARQAKDEQTAERVPMKKQWFTAGDSRVRAKNMGGGRGWVSHAAANGQIRNVDEPFDVGGERLMMPRDPAGNPENVINCRCNSVPYLEED